MTAAMPHSRSPRILVIDDDEIVAAGLLAALERDGYEVRVTGNGYDGVDALAHEGFELVITDLKMPGLSGIGVLERARELAPETRVIVISGYPSRSAADEVLQKGAAQFLVKPVDYARLREAVRDELASE